MRYVEEDELEATNEWLLRFNEAGISDELTFVPSELIKLGVPPVDVVDRIDWLVQQKGHGADGSGRGIVVAESEVAKEPEPAPAVDKLEDRLRATITEPGSLILDYDSYGAWEWAAPIEKMVEEAIFAVVDPDPELPDFSELAASCRLRPRSRGKRARAARAARTQG